MFHASRRTTVVASLAFAATTALGLAAVPTAAQAADEWPTRPVSYTHLTLPTSDLV